MKSCYITVLIFILFSSPLFAQKQFGIFSPEPVLAIATYERIYSLKEDYIELHFDRELSYNYFFESRHHKRYQYIISARYIHGETMEESCLILPEIGDWTIESHEKIKTNREYTLPKDITFFLKCFIYNSSDVVFYKYTMSSSIMEIDYKGTKHIASNWYCEYYGNRPSTENICHIRFARNSLYSRAIHDKKFEIFIVRDTSDGSPTRLFEHYDDVYFYHNDSVNDNYPADFTCFIVPRIFFVKFEEPSLSIDITDDLSPIRFTIIVQQFENPGKTVWNYHRLEIVREQSAHEIQINDLGPIPRSEWEPDWPDPATMPLWKEPESECAQCQ